MATVIVVAAGCVTPPAPQFDVAVVPAHDERRYYVFAAGRVTLNAATGEVRREWNLDPAAGDAGASVQGAPPEPVRGKPTAHAWNGDDFSVVCYPGWIAVLERGTEEPEWRPLENNRKPARSAGLGETRCALVEAPRSVRILDLADLDAAPSDAATYSFPQFDEVHYAVPTGEQELVVVGTKGWEVQVWEFNVAGGKPEFVSKQELLGINRFGRAASAGTHLVVAGLDESSTRSELEVKYRFIRVDLGNLKQVRFVDKVPPRGEPHILDLAVFKDRVAAYLWSFDRDSSGNQLNELVVYETQGNQPVKAVYEKDIARGSNIFWMGNERIGELRPAAAAAERPDRRTLLRHQIPLK